MQQTTLKSPWRITTIDRNNPKPGEPTKKLAIYYGNNLVAKYNGELKQCLQVEIPDDIKEKIDKKWARLQKGCCNKVAVG
jgi:hypothetical protein